MSWDRACSILVREVSPEGSNPKSDRGLSPSRWVGHQLPGSLGTSYGQSRLPAPHSHGGPRDSRGLSCGFLPWQRSHTSSMLPYRMSFLPTFQSWGCLTRP